ncbi:MAG: hypothetical protein GY820_04415 [Gammaproteobacteria bacterium]|nr:hypothetical protein [Gammaproteobacteria bacterium]
MSFHRNGVPKSIVILPNFFAKIVKFRAHSFHNFPLKCPSKDVKKTFSQLPTCLVKRSTVILSNFLQNRKRRKSKVASRNFLEIARQPASHKPPPQAETTLTAAGASVCFGV